MFDGLRKDASGIIKHTVELVYFMRGAISYTEMKMMTPGEREVVADFIKERLEVESKRMNPVY
jgi:hypothetical protein